MYPFGHKLQPRTTFLSAAPVLKLKSTLILKYSLEGLSGIEKFVKPLSLAGAVPQIIVKSKLFKSRHIFEGIWMKVLKISLAIN